MRLISLAALSLSSFVTASSDSKIVIPDSVKSIVDDMYDQYDSSQCLFSTRELLEHGVFFAETIMYPNNTVQADMINSTIFSEDIVGKIDITRTYEGRELNTEYVYGLFVSIADQNTSGILGFPTSYEIYEFASNCDEYTVSFVVNATIPQIDNSISFEADFWIKLNSDMEVTQYDLSFKRWPLVYDYLLKMFSAALTETTQLNSTQTIPDSDYTVLSNMMADSICSIHEVYCTGDNVQYDSYDDCFSFLTDSIRFGTSFEGGRNTLFCRMIHQNMVPLRPSVHCPHIGPSGGDMCLDDEATELYNLLYSYDETWSQSFIGIS